MNSNRSALNSLLERSVDRDYVLVRMEYIVELLLRMRVFLTCLFYFCGIYMNKFLASTFSLEFRKGENEVEQKNSMHGIARVPGRFFLLCHERVGNHDAG